MDIQFIGADLGRGYLKGYTFYKGIIKHCIIQSTVGEGRELDYSRYDKPIHLNIDGEECFIGELAEKESFNCISNYSDDKTSIVAQKLLFTLLNELSMCEFVNVCIGVPNKMFNKTMLEKVNNEYSGRKITIKDRIKNTNKTIFITKVNIFKEADAALIEAVNSNPKRVELQGQRNAMATVGFRTTELSYFDKYMKYNDKLSKTLEIGNRTVLDEIQKKLSKKGIVKELNEIDNDKDYAEFKAPAYKSLAEKINQSIEMNWINWREVNIFIAGGTSIHFKYLPEKFIRVEEPQLITAKGLFYIAEKRG